MYGHDVDFAVVLIAGWVGFMVVAAVVQWFVAVRVRSPFIRL